ncbi:MAG: putative Fe-S cluster assembly protein SufT [Chromatiales bacterium]|nr:putative Fe-S cluster assembly protein SufT [Chromatiales bacterium]
MSFQSNEPVTLTRDVDAIAVPSGLRGKLPEGTTGAITQALGGSFTLFVQGNLYRIAGTDADALDKEPLAQPTLDENASDEDVEKLVWEQLHTCFDPEIPINIVDLGLVYKCEVTHLDDGNRKVRIDMTLTAPGCGMGSVIQDDVKSKVELIPTVSLAEVELVFDPPWDRDMMSDAAKLETGMYY